MHTLRLHLIFAVSIILGLSLPPTWGMEDLPQPEDSRPADAPMDLLPTTEDKIDDPELDVFTHIVETAPEIKEPKSEEAGLATMPLETLLNIFQHLSIRDLCCVGVSCKYLEEASEVNSLWFPLYQRANLLPGFDIPVASNPHVTSYKHQFIAIRILQTGLKQGLEPVFDPLLSSVSKAFMGKVIVFKLKSTIFSLKNEPQMAKKYWNKYCLEHLTPDAFNQAVFFGEYGFNAFPEDRRLSYLREQEARGNADAQRWVDQALCQGQLGQGQRSVLERMEELDQRIMAGDQNASLMVIGPIIQGQGLGQENRSPSERFATLDRYGRQGVQQAQQAVVKAIYDGTLGQDTRSEEERYQDLRTRARAGDSLAKSYVVQALSQGGLGQGTREEQARFDELLSLDRDSAYHVLHALLQGSLGQDLRSPSDRIQQIETLMLRPPSLMRCYPSLIDMIVEGKGLGQEERSADDRFSHLERLANMGISEAQEKLLEAIYEGKLGQEALAEAKRFAKLEEMAQSGTFAKIAIQRVIQAIKLGHLDQKQLSADERYHKLKIYVDKGLLEKKVLLDIINHGGFTNQKNLWLGLRLHEELEEGSKLSNDLLVTLKQELADQGDLEAQKWLNQTLYEGTFGQDRNPFNRFNQLRDQAIKWDKDAEERVVQAIVSGDLGQSENTPADRFNSLSFWAGKGNLKAQQEVAKAIAHGLLEQNLRDDDARVNDLRRMAEEENIFAADELVEILIFGRLGQSNIPQLVRFNEIDALSRRGNSNAQQRIVDLLTTGIHGMFVNEHGPQWEHQFFGQDQRRIEERFQDLATRALAGNTLARREVIRNLCQETVDQQRELSLQNLLFWVALGDEEALRGISSRLLAQPHNPEGLAQFQRFETLYKILELLHTPK
jgi:hypothetical protein